MTVLKTSLNAMVLRKPLNVKAGVKGLFWPVARALSMAVNSESKEKGKKPVTVPYIADMIEAAGPLTSVKNDISISNPAITWITATIKHITVKIVCTTVIAVPIAAGIARSAGKGIISHPHWKKRNDKI